MAGRQISCMGLLLETFSRNGSVSKVIPAWCSFLRRAHANRRREWRVPSRRATWQWCRHLQWHFAGAWTRQSNWRVEGAEFLGCRQQRLFPRGLQSATCRMSPASMAFWLAKSASTNSNLRCLRCLNPPSPVDHSREKKTTGKRSLLVLCLSKNEEGVLLWCLCLSKLLHL